MINFIIVFLTFLENNKLTIKTNKIMKTIKNYLGQVGKYTVAGVTIILLTVGLLVSISLINVYALLVYPFKYKGEGLRDTLCEVTVAHLRWIQLKLRKLERSRFVE